MTVSKTPGAGRAPASGRAVWIIALTWASALACTSTPPLKVTPEQTEGCGAIYAEVKWYPDAHVACTPACPGRETLGYSGSALLTVPIDPSRGPNQTVTITASKGDEHATATLSLSPKPTFSNNARNLSFRYCNHTGSLKFSGVPPRCMVDFSDADAGTEVEVNGRTHVIGAESRTRELDVPLQIRNLPNLSMEEPLGNIDVEVPAKVKLPDGFRVGGVVVAKQIPAANSLTVFLRQAAAQGIRFAEDDGGGGSTNRRPSSIVYEDERYKLHLVGTARRWGEVAAVALATERVAHPRCSGYRNLTLGFNVDYISLSVFNVDVVVHDRNSGRVIAKKFFPAPHACPKKVTTSDVNEIGNFRVKSDLIEDWLKSVVDG